MKARPSGVSPPPNSRVVPGEASGGVVTKKNTLAEIQRLQRDRDERRRVMEQAKIDRAAEDQRNRDAGNPGDVDFQRMIRGYREHPTTPMEQPHRINEDMKICICVRKRPVSVKEVRRNDYDSVTCLNPLVVVHDCKLKVDGISKYLDNQAFQFDHTFHEENTTEDVYGCAVQPLVEFCVHKGGRATVFAYGQTGSGKTHTMVGIQALMAQDLFALLNNDPVYANIQVAVSFFEIYGGRCQDLLNERSKLSVREDGQGEVVVADLTEVPVTDAQALGDVIDNGNANRTTHATESNDESSRSHAICQITLYDTSTITNPPPAAVGRGLGLGQAPVAQSSSPFGSVAGRMSLIDLAGSERGADTQSNNRQRRMEGAEINKSLLALKECIRALDNASSSSSNQQQHVPYRGSKLTLVLKESFCPSKKAHARTVMITTVSPAASSADHTINSLRYADRVKEKTVTMGQGQGQGVSPHHPMITPNQHTPPPPIDNSSNNNRNKISPVPTNINPPRQPVANPAAIPRSLSGAVGVGASAGVMKKSASVNAVVANVKSIGSIVAKATEEKTTPTAAKPVATNQLQQNNNPNNIGRPVPHPYDSLDSKDIAQHRTPSSSSSSSSSSDHKRQLAPNHHPDHKMMRQGAAEDFPAVAVAEDKKGLGQVREQGYKHGYNNNNDSDVGEDEEEEEEDERLNQSVELHSTLVESLFDEEEALLTLHMEVIQENAELLTEEGRLLQQVQNYPYVNGNGSGDAGDVLEEHDVDRYAQRLDEILQRKQELITMLRGKLALFRQRLVEEELAATASTSLARHLHRGK